MAKEAPFTGKRSIRYTNAGNIRGYVGGRFYCHIGERWFAPDEELAAAWVAGEVDL